MNLFRLPGKWRHGVVPLCLCVLLLFSVESRAQTQTVNLNYTYPGKVQIGQSVVFPVLTMGGFQTYLSLSVSMNGPENFSRSAPLPADDCSVFKPEL